MVVDEFSYANTNAVAIALPAQGVPVWHNVTAENFDINVLPNVLVDFYLTLMDGLNLEFSNNEEVRLILSG